jgi:uncharacterized protein YbgA (DUF1722 family)
VSATADRALERFRSEVLDAPQPRRLVGFHTRNKMLILAHDPARYRAMGRLVAQAGATDDLGAVTAEYRRTLRAALQRPPTRGRHLNVLQHMNGMTRAPDEQRAALAASIVSYGSGGTDLGTVVAEIRAAAETAGDDWVADQTYLSPAPDGFGPP